MNALVVYPTTRLKHLALAQNQFTTQSLYCLHFILDICVVLEVLEVDRIGPTDDLREYDGARTNLMDEYHNVIVASKPLTFQLKLAFLSVVRRLCDAGVEYGILDSIFDMAAEAIPRQIMWHEPK